ncbi:hypothetical protein PV327_007155 [Microctonus hyperodae]|uniref:Galactose mutarotase n=1 Tax=Microctonus hyperodae TaxID=165561 RepID=A0AA39KJ63_MICHY|nr:hypothetical protein PV327_007155 [Microctonus hyperodae]
MAKHPCDCKDATIVEGNYGRILQGKNSQRHEISNINSSDQGDKFNNTEHNLVKSYTMTNVNRMEVILISWGATIVSIKCPDKYGETADVVLGFDNIDSYRNSHMNPFIGCILGRCANRIKNGLFTIADTEYKLTLNDDKCHLHGGTCGFGRQLWNSQIDGCNVVMSYLSDDGEEGYPGAVLITVKFKLTVDNRLEINIRASSSKPTIINISHASFFNLAGHDAGEDELKNHIVTLNCDRWTFTDSKDPIPTGAIQGVGGTVMDLRIPKKLDECMSKVPPGEGFDHNFCVVQSWQPGVVFIGRALHPKSGRVLEVYSDQPGVQFYTCGRFPKSIITKDSLSSVSSDSVNTKQYDDLVSYDSYLDGQEYEGEYIKEKFKSEWNYGDLRSDSGSLVSMNHNLAFISGKNGAHYTNYCAFTLQPQNYPNAINIKDFPCPILRPGQVYYHDLTYKFGVQLGNGI